MTKHADTPTQAPDRPAFEITEEMISAGAMALGDNSECSARMQAKLVYEAMEGARLRLA